MPNQGPGSIESRYAWTMTDNSGSAGDSRSGAENDSGNGTPASNDGNSSNARPERRGPPPNPLYHPLFLPVLLIAFTLWFGWDGFLTTDPKMLEHQNFNRIMFYIMLPLSLFLVPRGIKDFREEQAAAEKKQVEGNSG